MSAARFDCCLLLLCGSMLAACADTNANGNEEGLTCPSVDRLEANPVDIPAGETSTMVAIETSDPDAADEPESQRAISTNLTSSAGTFDDPTADLATFTCDPTAEGPVEICVDAVFEDEADLPDEERCVDRECITVTCANNLCPIIEQLDSVPGTTEDDQLGSTIYVQVRDPDNRPEPLQVTLTAEAGTFDDRNSLETRYRCDIARTGAPIEICVHATDGDEDCDQTECIEVECNICPNLNILNAIPSLIPDPNKIAIQWRGADADEGPLPLTAKLTASSGSFDDPTAADSVFTCDTPGVAEVCVEISDGACVKSDCIVVLCPEP